MGITELLLVAVGLSMDAFAVSVGKGLSMKRLNVGQAAVIALFFGGFQALMPALGWLLGAQFEQLVSAVQGWIAFALLAFIGAKMIWDALHEGEDEGDSVNANSNESAVADANADASTAAAALESGREQVDASAGAASANCESAPALDLRELVLLAVATSIDAFAAGVAFAMLDVNIVFSVTVIGIVTFVLSFGGVAIGNQFGSRWEKPSAIVGGVVLILIGLKVLVESLL